MSQREKLIARIRSRPSEARFEDVEAVLNLFGWRQTGGKGSHATFTRPGEPAITIPKAGGQKVKRRYLDLVCDRLGLDD